MTHSALTANVYGALAICVLALHGIYILWVIFGALIALHRPLLRRIHIASLVWGILMELTPWACPLTLLENWFEAKGGVQPDSGGFLLHYLDKLIYPDVSAVLLIVVGVAVCVLNLAIYLRFSLAATRVS